MLNHGDPLSSTTAATTSSASTSTTGTGLSTAKNKMALLANLVSENNYNTATNGSTTTTVGRNGITASSATTSDGARGIGCKECGKRFCLPHRFPADHQCELGLKSTNTGTNGKSAERTMGKRNGKVKEEGSGTKKAWDKVVRTTTASPPTPPSSQPPNASRITPLSPSVPAATKSNPSPASKVNLNPIAGLGLDRTSKRAKAERASAARGMEVRARKG